MKKIINKIKKKYTTLIGKLSRKRYLKNKFGKYGKIKEENDKIVIQATSRNIKKNKKYTYSVELYDTKNFEEEMSKSFELLKLNKPIYFIFDNIKFKGPIQLYSLSLNTNIIFKNCTFVNGIQINTAGSTTLENNIYINWMRHHHYGNSFLSCHVKELTIKNDKFINSYEAKNYGKNNFGISAKAEHINIINSEVDAESKGQINIDANEIIINNSTINGPEVYINTDNLLSEKSSIHSPNGVMIDDKNNNFNGEVQAPIFIYNGINLGKENNTISIDKEKIKLQKTRKELIETLRKIRRKCYQINAKEIEELKMQQCNSSISKILTK